MRPAIVWSLLLSACGGVSIDGVELGHTFFFDQQVAPGRPRTISVRLSAEDDCETTAATLILAAGDETGVVGRWTVGGSRAADRVRAQWSSGTSNPELDALGIAGYVEIEAYEPEKHVAGSFDLTLERIGPVSGSFDTDQLCVR